MVKAQEDCKRLALADIVAYSHFDPLSKVVSLAELIR